MGIGWLVRPFRPEDLPGLTAAVSAAARADRETFLPTAEDLAARLAAAGQEPDLHQVWVAVEERAGVVGYAQTTLLQEPGAVLLKTKAAVHPGFRRRGIGRALLERQLQQAAALAAGDPARRVILGASASDRQVANRALLEGSGFRPVRWYYEMFHPLVEDPPMQEPPPGFVIEPLADRLDERGLYEAVCDGFRGHWGWHPEPFASFQARLSSQRIQPRYSLAAWQGETLVGAALNDMGALARERLRHNWGWVMQLFVRPAWRGQGLGGALLGRTIRLARETGHDRLGLNVDTANTSGAVHLYEAMGFRPASQSVLYYKEIYPAGPGTNQAGEG